MRIYEQRCGYTVGHVMDVIAARVLGFTVLSNPVLPKPSVWTPSACDCRGHVSAPDYIGQEVQLNSFISVTLGWVAE